MPLPVTKHFPQEKSSRKESESIVSADESLDRRFRPEPEDPQSGTLAVPLGGFPGGSAFADLAFTVTGKSFYGKLGNFSGAAVTESQVTYDQNGATHGPGHESQRAFILDFGGLRSLLQLYLDASAGRITLVLPWLGTGFADKSLYPPPSGGPDFKPARDGSGATQVAFPGTDTQKLLVQVQPASGNAFSVAQLQASLGLRTATFPANVKAGLEGRLPFWTRPGPLNGNAQVTGLAADLNAFLSGRSGEVPAKLILSSDTPGVLSTDLTVSGLRPDLQATAQWGGQASLEVGLQGLRTADVDVLFPAAGSKAWRVDSLALTLKGKFPAWRAFAAQSSAVPGSLGLAISARFSVARRLDFDDAVEVNGFSLPIPPADAALIVELFPDAQGRPAPGKPLASVPVSLSAPAPGAPTVPTASSPLAPSPPPAASAADPVWTDILLPAALSLKPGGYWLTAKAKTGSCEWRGTGSAEGEAATMVSQEGGPWRALPRLNPHAQGAAVTPLFPGAQALVLRKPLPRENLPLLDIEWPAGSAQARASADVGADAATVSLRLDGGATQELMPQSGLAALPIRLTARATGTLTLAATAAYKEKTA
jgi:hypothetical protein